MQLHRFVIGIQLNKKMFRISSSGGELIDEILSLRESESKIGDEYFTQISTSFNSDDLHVSFLNEDKTHIFTISAEHVVFKKTSPDGKAAINTEKAYQEFEVLWKKADKILKFPAIRRIGIVAELRLNEKQKHSASNDLIKALVNVNAPDHSGRFHLSYEDKQLMDNGEIPNKETDDYWNINYSYYVSDRDETPEKGKINANLDVQKYYNPAKSNALAELKKVKIRFIDKKKLFKASLKEMGFE